jgi:hypothetical protein
MTQYTVIEPNFSNILFKTSFIFGLNTMFGLYNYFNKTLQFNDVLLTNTLLFITSINYWRNPTYGIRRTIDIFTALTNIIYNTYTIDSHPNAWICYISIKFIIVAYMMSWYYQKQNKKKIATVYHCLVHIFGNIGNFIILNT